jgi:hypothetical protein
MKLSIATVVVALISSAVELTFLHAIFTHPAGGPDGSSNFTRWAYYAVALIPYASIIAWAIGAPCSVKRKWFYRSVIVGLIGIALALIALRQYGHATPVLLLLGYIAQWVVIGLGVMDGRSRQS